MRPLTAAIGSGSISGFAVTLARELLRNDPWVPVLPEQCPIFELPQDWRLDSRSLCLGILFGLVALPLLDLLVVLRIQWFRWLRLQIPGTLASRPLHRVVG